MVTYKICQNLQGEEHEQFLNPAQLLELSDWVLWQMSEIRTSRGGARGPVVCEFSP